MLDFVRRRLVAEIFIGVLHVLLGTVARDRGNVPAFLLDFEAFEELRVQEGGAEAAKHAAVLPISADFLLGAAHC